MTKSELSHLTAEYKRRELLGGRFLRSVMNALSPAGAGARLTILIYHRVLPGPDPLFPEEIDAETFDRQISLLGQFFKVLSLPEAAWMLRDRTLPQCAACVTFDDGYADNIDIALPILKKYSIPATFFVASGFLDGGRMWNDTVIELVRRAPGHVLDLRKLGLGTHRIETLSQRRLAIRSLLSELKYLPLGVRTLRVDEMCSEISLKFPNNLMMTSGQVRELHAAGMEIGAHTMNHPILATLELAAAKDEILNGKKVLEKIIGAPVRCFAYPNGKPGRDYLAEHVEIVRRIGFDAAVSTSWGAAGSGSDVHQLPRFTPWDRGTARFIARMVQNLRRHPLSV